MPTYLSPGVYVEEVPAGSKPLEGVGTAVAAFVGLAAQGPFNEPTLVSNWTQFTSTFGGFIPGSYLATSVQGYFLNGGGNCYVVRIGHENGAGGRGSSRSKDAPPELAPGPQATLGRITIRALDPAAKDESIAVEVSDAGGESPSDDMFKLVVKRDGKVVEEYDRATLKSGKANVATVVNAASKLITIEDAGSGSLARPESGETALATPPPPAAVPANIDADDYVGDVSERTGFAGLESVDEITMLSVPDLMSAYQQGAIDLDTVQAVQLGMIAHCELMGDRMAILDAPPGLNAQQIKEWRVEAAGYDSPYATLYWPWIKSPDPITGQMTFMPPSGHLAGIWGRNDDTRGVHKAPANEVVRGAVSLETQITRNEHDLLNPVGINCIRAFPGQGIRVWGARTLSSDPEWRYVNIRRLFNYLEESILNGTNWAVFEPNDQALWAKLRRTISAFLVNEWRKGALFGSTPDEAFFVKCDDETNPAEGIDAGQVVCLVGVAPVKPAEFVIFRLSQFSGGTSLVSE
ncbi:phage tail sheath subtilisin-like domain-containing protein [Ornithinimicrobium sp. F0845]|uniref:phage tail sheath family protein n=1 Tax=Ornithinimicrobium sp. F0845 TaxID=2926412 RepID=UPI001FF55353|nr:phage tail sheath subtilisin-like domain-containing protein [Ornithinimicrobium sp. F0845]MCK0113067.1 phage tail sheath subtilisin-like domain-containing protein [Ornithinimicrobium sp. F0845]